MTDDSVAFNAAIPGVLAYKHKTFSAQEIAEKIIYPVETETVDSLQLEAHSISIFASYKAAFYGSYLPHTYGGANIICPEDKGALMINFCLHPGTYQPSGHINISRAREFYLKYVSNYVTSATPADLLVVAYAINFLLISDGSAVLRYST
jgi:hypothetical protein